MIIRNRFLFAVLGGLVVSGQSVFGILNVPVPTNAYITKNGLDWAWADSVPASYGTLSLSYQAQFGWHIPTAAELALAPLATDFLVSGGNVPFNSSDPVSGAYFNYTNSAYAAAQSAGAVALPYFGPNYGANWVDGLGQTETSLWAGMAGAPPWADQLVVRRLPDSASTLGLMSLALGAIALLRRRVWD